MKKLVFYLAAFVVLFVPFMAHPLWAVASGASESEHVSNAPQDIVRYAATAIFLVAIAHTFLVGKFNQFAHKFKEGSIQENFFHLLGEVEVVFLFWSGIFVTILYFLTLDGSSVEYMENLNFTEPLFVFVIMIISATKPVIDFADRMIRKIDKYTPYHGSKGFLATALIFGPILGSIITEPAAMSLTALILYRAFYKRGISTTLKYAIIAVLFVNVSIGGSLTNFAAPPVIMVASKWDWDLSYMFLNFGWKAVIAIVFNAYFVAWKFKSELSNIPLLADSDLHGKGEAEIKDIPLWISLAHGLFLAFVVLNAHHPVMFMGAFIFFLGFVTVTKEYQEPLKLRESLMVAGFLGGLITLGTLQSWWIQPLLSGANETAIFVGSVLLTSVTDNAALTYLASQVSGLSDIKKYLVVAGALAGGGTTVIANAPNPVGYSVLRNGFGDSGMDPIQLLKWALFPTSVAIACYILLPSIV